MSDKFRNVVITQALIGLLFATTTPSLMAQSQTGSQVAKATINSKPSTTDTEPTPVFIEYRGVKIGMAVKEVRDALENYLKAKGDKQDFLVLSDNETAQVFYDGAGKVMAISIDYAGKNSNTPTPMSVLGTDIEPKADGSMYALKRYPMAGYWVSYNRTSGENATVTITMQALR